MPRRSQYGRQSRAQLLVICGPPCAGKSTLAKSLGDAHRAPVLDVDEMREVLLPHSDHSEQDRNTAYRAMHFAAARLIGAGAREVLLVATYARLEVREWLGAAARDCLAGVSVVGCRVSPEVAVDRFVSRKAGHPATDLSPARVRRLAETYNYDGVATINANATTPEMQAEAEALLRRLAGGSCEWPPPTIVGQ